MADVPNREELIRKVVGLCNRIPGSSQWNAAEWMYDELSALLSERERRTPDVVAWQPIETAPKDGTRVILSDGAWVRDGFWERWGDGGGSWCHAIVPVGYENGADYVETVPTHWMPRPAAPSLSTSAGGGERG